MKTAIIQYNGGNVCSVQFALERIGANAVITDDAETILSADRVIFPGVGQASSAMQYLRNRGLDRVIKHLRQPVLGICLGMQLLCDHSEEGDTSGLGIFPLQVKRFQVTTDLSLKVPLIGWNTISNLASPVFGNIPENSYMYFVHSYYAPLCEYTVAQACHAAPYSAALQKDNFYAVQFHPEKSGDDGQQLLKHFLNLY
ncbi:MAG: imidazole glycerol phosphate synthase subunit HisH [Bacteroidetes bacterium]|nr:imidazole glycerol phosphate synthase subunit HisH [Bacteroidota bacterium]